MAKETLTRGEFLRLLWKAGASACLMALFPSRAATDSSSKGQESRPLTKKEIAQEKTEQGNPEGLFDLYDSEIREAISIYEKSQKIKPIFSVDFLKSFLLCLSGSIPTCVSGISPDGELIGLGRIPKNKAGLSDGTALDLTDPTTSVEKVIESLTFLIMAKVKSGVRSPDQMLKEAIYDYIDGAERKDASQQARFLGELILTVYNDVAYGKRKLLPNLAQYPIIRQIIEEGLRYHQLSPSWPIDPQFIKKVLPTFMVSTFFQPEGHWGWDFIAPANTPISAVARGEVVWCGWAYGRKDTNAGHGQTVILKHQPNKNLPPVYTIYAHMDEKFGVGVGENIRGGTYLGRIGDNSKLRGASDTPHTHFAVYKDGKVVINNGVAQMAGGDWVHPLSMLPEGANYPGMEQVAMPPKPETPPAPATPQPEEPKKKGVDPSTPDGKETPEVAKNGRELLKKLGLEKMITLVVYGRPGGHGSLGVGGLTAEGSWKICLDRQTQVLNDLKANPVKIGKDGQPLSDKDFVWPCINPVDQCKLANGKISARLADVYVLKALELAIENKGGFVIDLGVFGIGGAKKVIEHIETITKQKFVSESGGLTKACRWLSHLGFTWDLEWMPWNVQAKPSLLNEPNLWFAKKHADWNKIAGVVTPGIVGIYAFKPGVNVEGVKQYYPEFNTLIPIIFDGYGNAEDKLARLGGLKVQLEKNRASSEISDNPPLLGIMEFTLRWGQGYDRGVPSEHLKTLDGAPTFFFGIQ